MLRSSRDIIRRLRQSGFELVSVRGSHHKFLHPERRLIVIVPPSEGRLAARDGSVIYRQAGWERD